MSDYDRLGRTLILIVSAWLAVTVVTLMGRHAFVIDETRYLSVAWEMWLRGDLLVPHLNGEPYHHKPPLLFWLVNLSWALFGVSDWAARLVPALGGLAATLLAIPLGRLMWPDRRAAAHLAAWILFTTLIWLTWTTAMMFDVLVALSAEIALLGIMLAWRKGSGWSWALTGLGIGLGILAKGPVILVYVLPAALFAPWWMTADRPRSWRTWYVGTFGALALGAAIGLGWALPAAAAGGEDYAAHILWGQTAGRMVDAFDHGRPVWWYLPLLPLLLFPWSFWLPVWSGIRERWREKWDSGDRLALCWLLAGIGILSLISGKQIHYIMPLLPAFALLISRVLPEMDARPPRRLWYALPVIPGLLLGIGMIAAPYAADWKDLPEWVAQLAPMSGGVTVIATVLVLVAARWLPASLWPGALTLILVLTSHFGILRAMGPYYEVAGIGELIGRAQRAGKTIAFDGKYRGEFNFVGRLEQPILEIGRYTGRTWLVEHPEALLVKRSDVHPEQGDLGVLCWQGYRTNFLVLWDTAAKDPHPPQCAPDTPLPLHPERQ